MQKADGEEQGNENVYKSLVGCLCILHPLGFTSYIISVLARFLHCPSKIHMVAAKKGSKISKFSKVESFELQCYSDSDWVGSLDAFCF